MLNNIPQQTLYGLMDLIYPVGSYYITESSALSTEAAMNTKFGGTWERVTDVFLLGAGNSYGLGDTGGSKDAILVSHSHSVTITSNGETPTINVAGGQHITFGNNANSGGIMLRSSNGWKESATLAHMTTTTSDQGKIGTGAYDVYYGKIDMVINSAGSSGTGKNMPPYRAVYMYRRRALSGGGGLTSLLSYLYSLKGVRNVK